METLAIKDLAARTGLAPGTIRMWEQRYGFPAPERTPAGYRRYTEDDVEAVRRVLALRDRGLSAAAAIERARGQAAATDRPSLYAAVREADPAAHPQLLRKRTLLALSRAIEHEALARAAAPVLLGAFQEARFFRDAEHRYRRLARHADAVCVFADFPEVRRREDGVVEVPIAPGDAVRNEWAVVVDAPGYAACLLAWEHPTRSEAGGAGDLDRRFECVWTLDARATRRAVEVGAQVAGQADPALGDALAALLADRPLALEAPSPALTALANRTIAYLEGAAGHARPAGG